MRTEKKVGKAVNDKPWKPNNAGHAGFLNNHCLKGPSHKNAV
jgi:hypothetical protein